MKAPCDAALARIFLGDDYAHGENALSDRLMCAAHDFGLTGTTVIRGQCGYGPAIRNVKPLLKLVDRPVVIELVDSELNLRSFLQSVTTLIQGKLITLQPVFVMQCGTPTTPAQGTLISECAHIVPPR